jgi:cell wall-associated NlpC family hydrolase
MQQFAQEVVRLGLRYEYEQGPNHVRTLDDAVAGGINCVSLAHLCIARQTGVFLSPRLKCTELYFDNQFQHLDSAQALPGDLAWLGRRSNSQPADFVPRYQGDTLLNWSDFAVNHVGIVVSNPSQPLQIMHASQYAGTVIISSLAELAANPRYAVLYGLSRLKT